MPRVEVKSLEEVGYRRCVDSFGVCIRDCQWLLPSTVPTYLSHAPCVVATRGYEHDRELDVTVMIET